MEIKTWGKPTLMTRFPHMLYHDNIVWRDILIQFVGRFSGVAYDIKVGTPSEVPESSPDWVHRVAEGCGCKRIDVVCQEGGITWVVEVKPYGNHAGLGQVLLYDDLFRRKFQVYTDVRMAVACATFDGDLANVCRRLGVAVWRTSAPGAAFTALPEPEKFVGKW